MQKDILAVIGGMGSGKSTVLHLLREQFHYETIEMDRLAKDCYKDRAFLSALRAFLPKKYFKRMEIWHLTPFEVYCSRTVRTGKK